MPSYEQMGKLPERPVRQRDGAQLRCPDHPDSTLYRGRTASGQIKTWCTALNCPHVAQWIGGSSDVR